jgi:hypothetical protein
MEKPVKFLEYHELAPKGTRSRYSD